MASKNEQITKAGRHPIPRRKGEAAERQQSRPADPAAKAATIRRLRRIAGQVDGVERMVEADRYCGDVLNQLAAVHSALRSVGRELMRGHLRHCVPDALAADAADPDAVYDEMLDLMDKNARS